MRFKPLTARSTSNLVRRTASVRHTASTHRFQSARRLDPLNEEALARAGNVDSNCHRAAKIQWFCELDRQLYTKLQDNANRLCASGSYNMSPDDMFNAFVSKLLATAIRTMGYVQERYELDQLPGEPATMSAGYAMQLRSESAAAFKALLATEPTKALLYASLIPPELHARFGIELNAGQRAVVERLMGLVGHEVLTQPELLAVRDYVHGDSPTFNLCRSIGLLKTCIGDERISSHAEDVLAVIYSGVNKLSSNQRTRLTAVETYKGVVNEFPWVEYALGRAMSRQTALPLEHPMSVTTDPNQSYANRPGYDHEWHFEGDCADVSIFHPESTLAQREALQLPGRYVPIKREEVLRETGEGFRLITVTVFRQVPSESYSPTYHRGADQSKL